MLNDFGERLAFVRGQLEKAQSNGDVFAKAFLKDMSDLARLPIEETIVQIGDFNKVYSDAPMADINIFGIFPNVTMDHYQEMTNNIGTTCLFVRDSGHENIYA